MLIYEGEYKEGTKNGKGKEYKNGRILFMGEFQQGKWWNGGMKKEKNIMLKIN